MIYCEIRRFRRRCEMEITFFSRDFAHTHTLKHINMHDYLHTAIAKRWGWIRGFFMPAIGKNLQTILNKLGGSKSSTPSNFGTEKWGERGSVCCVDLIRNRAAAFDSLTLQEDTLVVVRIRWRSNAFNAIFGDDDTIRRVVVWLKVLSGTRM